MDFPQYRRYKNKQSYFKIMSATHFTEYKALGKSWERYDIEAKILPDRNYIADMLHEYEAHWENISAEEFELAIS